MKYFLQLLGFAVVSEVPWYLLNGADGTHNVLFTLALGVMALAAFEALKKDGILGSAVFAHLTVKVLDDSRSVLTEHQATDAVLRGVAI